MTSNLKHDSLIRHEALSCTTKLSRNIVQELSEKHFLLSIKLTESIELEDAQCRLAHHPFPVLFVLEGGMLYYTAQAVAVALAIA